jgi:hypothetical protein
MYVDPATIEPVTELSTAVAEVVAERAPEDLVPAPAADSGVPRELRVLVEDARHDGGDLLARRSLALALLDRGWSASTAAAASGLREHEVSALHTVQRPGTAASSVADDLVAARRAAAAG